MDAIGCVRVLANWGVRIPYGCLDRPAKPAQNGRMRVSWWSRRDRVAVGVGGLLPLGVAGLLAPFRSSFSNTDAALVLVAAVVLVAANGHRIAGILAAVSAAVWFDFFLTKPYEHFSISGRTDIETTVLLVVVGAAVTEIAVRGRRQRVLARTDAFYLDAIASSIDVSNSSAAPSVVVGHVADQLTALLQLRACRFERGRYGGLPRLGVDGCIRTLDGATWDVDQFGMPDTEVELIAATQGHPYGRFVLTPTPGVAPTLVARRICSIVASQFAAARAAQVAHA